MRRPWPGYLPPLVAATVTMLACLLFDAASNEAVLGDMAAGLLALLLVPVPIVVSVLWGGAVIAARPHRLVLLAAAAWLVPALLLLPGGAVWPLASHMAAGLVAGFALGARWRLDAALAGIALVLLPLTIWSVVELPVGEQLDMIQEELRPMLEETLPATADETQREAALATEEARLGKALDLMARIYPFILVGGLLGQGLMVLVLSWLVVRIFGWRVPSWRPPPFIRWRLPFYLVWTLAVGVGLLVTRRPEAMAVGLNLALLSALLLSIQGVAVQFHVSARLLSPLGRVVFWTMMGLFATPLILVGGVTLGLADQWLDLRGLDRPPETGDDGRGTGKSED